MADQNLGAFNIADLGPEYLIFSDPGFQPPAPRKSSLKLLDSTRAIVEG